MKEETLKRDLCARLMEGVKAEILDYKSDYVNNKIDTIVGISQWSKCGKLWSVETRGGAKPSFERIKPYLFPTSALTKPIQIASYNNGEPFVPIEYFEVTDNHDTCPFEQDSGNIKLIRDLESIAKNNDLFDCIFLPKWVIDNFNEWHINYRLSPDQFIEVTDEFNPYK